MKNIGLFVKRGSKEAGQAARELISKLRQMGLEPLFLDELSEEYSIQGGIPIEEYEKAIDVMVVVGGDGTFLAGGRMASVLDVPILGINAGGLGFLTDTPMDEANEMLSLIVDGNAAHTDISLLDVQIKNNEVDDYMVLNDVVLGKSALARIIEIRVFIGEEFLTSMLADGLIISTPTGSTAYAMAAGGPICHPEVDSIILTPICPHLLANRPLLVPGDSSLRIELATEGEYFVTLDGQVGREFKKGDQIFVKKSKSGLRLIKNPNRTYFQTLRNKLRWGKR